MKTEASEYLSLLQEIQNNNVSTFTVVPADEPRFTIETNSRNIIVPSEFSFLSVQNDHRAETIYFEIDRYFDNVDLSQHTCVVQFINKSGTTINEGTYPVTSMDIDSVDGKIVFGWEIRNDATQLTGDITFSVRFYSIDNNGNFTYNFNTLTASSYILPSLNIIASGERITATELEVWTDKMNNLASSIESDIITVEEKIEELENYIAIISEDYTALTEEVSQLSSENAELKGDIGDQKISFGSWLFNDENKLKSKSGYIKNDLTYVSNDTWQCIIAPIDVIGSNNFINIYTELDFYQNIIPSLAFCDLNMKPIGAKYEKIPRGAFHDIPNDTKYVVMNTTSGAFNTDFNSVKNKIDKASSTLEASNIISKCDGEVITGYGLYTTTEPFYTRETSSVIRYKLEKGKTYTFKDGNTKYKMADGNPDNITRFANSNGKSTFTNVFGFEWCYVDNTDSSIQIYDRELFQLTNLYKNNFTFQRKGTANAKFNFVNQIVKKGDAITVNVACKTSSTVLIWLSNEARISSDIPSKKIEIVNGIGSYVAESDWNGFTIWANDEKTDNSYIVDVCVQNNSKDDVNKVVRVSAYNSSPYDKVKSDYICDGVNDEDEINQAIKDVIKNCGTVILYDGDYNIHKFNEYIIAGKKEKIAICVETSSEAKGVTIRGESENKVNSVNINLSNNMWDDVASDEIPSIFGGGSKEAGYVGGVGFDIKHISIYVNSREHKCIAINMQHAYWGIIDSCSIVVNGFGQDKIPCENLIGIRGFAGWTDGRNVEIKNTYVSGFRVAFQLGGEHVICKQLGARFNYTAYTFGEYPLDSGDVNPAQVHPITLINCCDEHSATLPKFYKSGNASDRGAGRCLVNFIDFNIEYYPLITGTPIVGAMEEFEGGWVGQIDYAIEDDEHSNKVGIPFWADGHGLNFKSTNTAQTQLGTTALRNSFAPNYMQQYYDTDLNKIVYCKEPSTKTWIDAMGIVVD